MKLAEEIIEAEKILEECILSLPYLSRTFYDENKATLKYTPINVRSTINFANQPQFLCHGPSHQGRIETRPLQEQKSTILAAGLIACYCPRSNHIYYRSDCLNLDMILHELNHVLSCDRKTETATINKQGFTVITKDIKIDGYALNEGATEWLVQKTLYGHDEYNEDSYLFETRISRLLCLAMGDDVFFKAYSKANVKGLNKSVKAIAGSKPMEDLIYFMDLIQEALEYDLIPDLDPVVPDAILKLETEKLLKCLQHAFNRIQRIIIDIYFDNPKRVINEMDAYEFASLLITDRMDNQKIKQMCDIFLKDNNEAVKYFLKKLELTHKPIAKTLRKVL